MRVAVLFDTSFSASAEIYEGIADIARSQGWELVALHSNQEAILWQALESARLDGVIAPFMSDRWIEALPRRDAAMVNISTASRIRAVSSVVPDDRAVGRLAAEHLLDSGHRQLACVHQPSDWASQCRLAGFSQAANLHGVEVLIPSRESSFSPESGWGRWLSTLSTPVGIFATDDFLARMLIEQCANSGRQVPGDVAVVGVGNSALDTVLAGMGISSVMLPLVEIGRRAAKRLIKAIAAPRNIVLECVLPERVMVRASSAFTQDQDPLISRALGVIDQRLADPPTVDELATLVGASRRTLEMRCRAILGSSPAQMMQSRRMALAQQLLKDTRLTVADISQQCGYANVHHFSSRFRALFGAPPGRWRLGGAA